VILCAIKLPKILRAIDVVSLTICESVCWVTSLAVCTPTIEPILPAMVVLKYLSCRLGEQGSLRILLLAASRTTAYDAD
jgi:hypothetical protein